MQAPITSTLLAEEPEMADLVETFIDGLPSSLDEIKTSIQNQDWSTLKKKIHDLKGLGGNFGYPMLFEFAKEIEAAIITQHYDDINGMLHELEAICHRIALGKPGQ